MVVFLHVQNFKDTITIKSSPFIQLQHCDRVVVE
jgi:hypothetical protein